jgi:hypothetical protein
MRSRKDMPMGPWQKKLIATRMAQQLIPAGTGAPLAVGLAALQDTARLQQAWREAAAWVDAAWQVIQTAPDNPYATCEAFAEAICTQVQARQRESIAQKGAFHG